MAAMHRASMLRRLLLAPPTFRTAVIPFPARSLPAISRQYGASPNVTQTSFWLSLVPKPFRKSPTALLKRKTKSKEWNPATFFIVIFLLIGSMSIQMITLRNDFTAFTRRADAKIGLLKEIIERIERGEKVDVEGLLGTGDANREREWEEVLQEIEREDQAWEQSKRSKPKHGRNLEEAKALEQENNVPEPEEQPAAPTPKSNAPKGFF